MDRAEFASSAGQRRGTGKRGGLRVIYYCTTEHERILLLTMYRKSEVSDLTPAEVKALRALVETLGEGKK